MRVLICGNRDYTQNTVIKEFIIEQQKTNGNLIIIHGAATGADTIASNAAKSLGIPTESYPAQWDKYGRGAGPIRNQQMLDTKPDLVVAFTHKPLSESKGTKDMITRARRAGVKTLVMPLEYDT